MTQNYIWSCKITYFQNHLVGCLNESVFKMCSFVHYVQTRSTCSCHISRISDTNTEKHWSTFWGDKAVTRSSWAVHWEGLWLPKHSENWGALLTFRLPETKGSSVLTRARHHLTSQTKMLITGWNRERDEKVERGRENRGRHERKRELEKDTKTLWSWENETWDRKRVKMQEKEGKGEAQRRKTYGTWNMDFLCLQN